MFDTQQIKRAGFEEALQQMPAAALIVEAPSGKIIFVNRQGQGATERYVGPSVPSELGDLQNVFESSGLESLHPDGRPYELQEWPLMRSIRSGEEVRDEKIVHLSADGRWYTVRCDSSPIYDDEGRIVAGVLVMHDITEQKRAEEVVEAVRRLRAGETIMPLEEVVELLRFAGSERREEYEARQAIEKLTPREREPRG